MSLFVHENFNLERAGGYVITGRWILCWHHAIEGRRYRRRSVRPLVTVVDDAVVQSTSRGLIDRGDICTLSLSVLPCSRHNSVAWVLQVCMIENHQHSQHDDLDVNSSIIVPSIESQVRRRVTRHEADHSPSWTCGPSCWPVWCRGHDCNCY